MYPAIVDGENVIVAEEVYVERTNEITPGTITEIETKIVLGDGTTPEAIDRGVAEWLRDDYHIDPEGDYDIPVADRDEHGV